MTAKPVRVCPACRGVARNRPLPPEGFWQVQFLQRIGMYPYRCEACGARFFRRVKVVEDSRTPPRAHAVDHVAQPRPHHGFPAATKDGLKVVAPPETVADDGLSHEDFVDLIDHISRSEQRKGLKAPKKDRADD